MASLLAGSSVVEVSGTDKNETGNWSEESDGKLYSPPELRRLLAIAITPR